MDHILEAFMVGIVLACNVLAQDAPPRCTDVDFAWSYNSKGQDPCAVAVVLDIPCVSGSDNSTFPPAGNASDHRSLNYVATNPQAPCDCNAVFYSVLSMCVLCQDLTLGAESLSFFGSEENCTSVTTYYPQPFPPGLAVPHWAFLPLTSAGYLDLSAAQADHNPDVTSNPGPALQSSTSQKPNIGAIVGGVVGGVFFFAAVSVSVWVFLRRLKKRAATSTPVAVPSSPAVVTPTTPAKVSDKSADWSPNLGNPPSMYYTSPVNATQAVTTPTTHQFTQQALPMQQQPWQGGPYPPAIPQV